MAQSNGYNVPSLTIQADDEQDDDDLVAIRSETPLVSANAAGDKGKARVVSPAPGVSGRIGSAPTAAGPSTGGRGHRQVLGGVAVETRFGQGSTLDEPLRATLMRDARAISTKMLQVLRPQAGAAPLQDWDLWGPLIACLTLAVILSLNAPDEQSLSVFTGIFVIVSIGSIAVTVNAKLLGGKVSFLQSLCVLGYCLFPLDVAAFVTLFVRLLWIRIPVCLAGFAWTAWAAVNFLGGTRLEDSRAFLAVYPCLLLFFALDWIVMLS